MSIELIWSTEMSSYKKKYNNKNKNNGESRVTPAKVRRACTNLEWNLPWKFQEPHVYI